MRSFLLPLALLATLPACETVCFVGNTLVATPDGPRRIADLAVGDRIYSCTPDGELVERTVVAIQRALARTVCRVTTDAGTVIAAVTPSHPFYDATRDAYVPLRDLQPDATLHLLRDDHLLPTRLQNVEVTEAPDPRFEVFDLTVSGPEHNFIADGVLVHNKSDNEYCGNGKVDQPNEQCDDGNQTPYDGCSPTCQIQMGSPPPTTGSLMTTSSTTTSGQGGFGGDGGMTGSGGDGASGPQGGSGNAMGGSGGT